MVIVCYSHREWPHGRFCCDLWEKNLSILEKQGVPRGFYGLRDDCLSPGHIQRFPGAVPVPLCWCKKHYY